MDPEPTDAYSRLAWHALRLVQWVQKAARGDLLRPGDHFGHPLIHEANIDAKRSINTLEDEHSLVLWKNHGGQHGEVKLLNDLGGHQSSFAVEFTKQGKHIFTPPWGTWVSSRKPNQAAQWVLLERPPFLPPWGFPATWGQLRGALNDQGVNLDPLLRRAIASASTTRGMPLLLIGYPVPSVIDGPDRRIQWQACELPSYMELSRSKGFRNTPDSWWLKAKHDIFGNAGPITWMLAQPHQAEELGSRGFLPESVRTQRYVVIGAGALGSAVAEHLVRSGVTCISVFDEDSIQTKNLVRHMLTLRDVPRKKSMQVTERLQAINTLVSPTGFDERYPPQSVAGRQATQAADVIIDTTAEASVIGTLGGQRWDAPKVIISLSLGWKAQSLYAHGQRTTRFKITAFDKAILPHVAVDALADANEPMPMEGIGCWTPVFPALHTDVQLLAAVGATFVREFVEATDTERTRVYQQRYGPQGFEGVTLRDPQP
ncbi:ThiF family adenylyltransferase [Deinococcus sp. QL22]|uniref:ThiF family adenylyltransferase n=1 Tax=Deinococcus sp. QL22 TaxID=2939437 RepID=UPI002016F0AE|nr:ThiF family adenylyltransferase [Deinococcus sp. QL22]UQN10206.1 ThiF family adenylyltransferase [Deinococcus sp. QL22]